MFPFWKSFWKFNFKNFFRGCSTTDPAGYTKMGLNSIQNGLKEELRKSCRQCLAKFQFSQCHCSWWFMCLLHRTTRTSSWNHRKIRKLLISRETKLEKFEIQSSKFTAEAWECMRSRRRHVWKDQCSWPCSTSMAKIFVMRPQRCLLIVVEGSSLSCSLVLCFPVSPAFGFSDFLEGSESWKICAIYVQWIASNCC